MVRVFRALAALATLVSLSVSVRAQSPATVRVNVSSDGSQSNGVTIDFDMSGDGRFVAFSSAATNLVADDTNAQMDVFVRDRLFGRTVRVSVSATGGEGAAASQSARISDDGRFVAFFSTAPGLVAGDTDDSDDVFVRDRDVDADGLYDEPGQVQTLRATVRSDGTPGACVTLPAQCAIGQDTFIVGFSGNGRHVLYFSYREFDPADTNGVQDLYAHDLVTRRTVRLTAPGGGALFSNGSMSRDGRFVLVSHPQPAGAQIVFAVLDRDADGNGVPDDSAPSLTPVPAPFPGAQHFPIAMSADSTLVVQGVFGGPTSELWITHRIGLVSRRVGTGTPGATQISSDNRRVAFDTPGSVPPPNPSPGPAQVVTFDADGDGHLDDQASIAGVSLPDFPGRMNSDFDATLRYYTFLSMSDTITPGDTNGVPDVFVHDRESPAFDSYDSDGDGLANTFESRFGLNAAQAQGSEGAAGDPDGDGFTNAQEQALGSHPRGVQTRYLAEGATGPFFSTRISVANPGAAHARVLLRYQTDTGHTTSTFLTVPVLTRQFVNVSQVPSLASASFSTVIESDVPVIVDRSMFWTTELYGSSAETSIAAPATTWYLAEGATHGFFDLFYLLQNPSATQTAQVEARFLLPSGAPVVRTYTVPPSTRLNILVDTIPGLEATDVSSVVSSTNGVPIIVERAMYYSRDGQVFRAGHASAGVTAPATTWRLAEGATGSFFDLFVLIANPSATPADVRMTYLRPSGAPIHRTRTVAPNSRLTVYVEHEDPALADTPVSTVVESTNGVPIVVERAMWWPTPGDAWQEAHNSFGATQSAIAWGFADGEEGLPPVNTQTYFLIANDNPTPALVAVQLMFESGPASTRHYTVPANSRFNVPVRQEFPEAMGRGFGAFIISMGTPGVPIVVERAMYSDANGVVWAAGTNALGTVVFP
jgi:hypothetical protein